MSLELEKNCLIRGVYSLLIRVTDDCKENYSLLEWQMFLERCDLVQKLIQKKASALIEEGQLTEREIVDLQGDIQRCYKIILKSLK